MKIRLLFISIIICFVTRQSVLAQTNQTVVNGAITPVINFPGTGCVYSWVNSNPAIGLAASGTGNIASFTAINTTNIPVTATITATPVAAGFAYIANQGSNSVTVINTVTNTVVTTITVGLQPFGVALSPDGTRIFVSNGGDNTISVIDAATNMVTSTVPLSISPSFLTMSPDGSRLYISTTTQTSLSVLSTSTGFPMLATINLNGTATSVAVSPDGNTVYATLQLKNLVAVINAQINTVTTNIPVGSGPVGAAISPDGSRLYVTNFSGSALNIINTTNNTVIGTLAVGSNPYGISVSPDGKKVYVSNEFGNSISVINTATNSVTITISANSSLGDLSLTPDGSRLYVTTFPLKTVSVYNTATTSLVTIISVGNMAYSYGNFISAGIGCKTTPVTFTITVNPTPQPAVITANAATGNISACAGSASAAPSLQQFTLSGNNLMADITAAAPAGFEVSAIAGSGYGATATITQVGGVVNNSTVYVRSAATAAAGSLSGNVVLSSANAVSQNVTVSATINKLPAIASVANQTLANGTTTAAVNFTGPANTINWVNSNPSIGLAASGTGNIASFTAINTGSTPTTATITATPWSAALAYIVNGGSNTVSVINTASSALISTVKVGSHPFGVAVSPDGTRAYITNTVDNSISVIDAVSITVISTIQLPVSPSFITVSPDGSRLYVSTPAQSSLFVLSTAVGYPLLATISLSDIASNVAVSPDGSTVYTSIEPQNTISVINTVNNTITANIAVASNPVGAAISPDGTRLYITNYSANLVTVINTANNMVIGSIAVGNAPYGIVVSPDGQNVYVSNQYGGSVSVINTATNTVGASITVPINVGGVSLTQDGSLLYVTNYLSNSVLVISTANMSLVGTIPVGTLPTSYGNFISAGTSCKGIPITFTITVNPTIPVITAGLVIGSITACAGSAAISPEVERFSVSAVNLTSAVTVTAPQFFDVSLNPVSGYAAVLTLAPTGGLLNSTTLYVRSTALASGKLNGSIQLSTPGGTTQNIAVSAVINPLPLLNAVASQTVVSGNSTAAINFSGTANTFQWINNTPSIGLSATGFGSIKPFTAINTGTSPVNATVTVIPVSAGFAYIANSKSNTVSVINTTSQLVVATIPVGTDPWGVAISPDGSKVYVTNQNSDNVSVIDTKTNTVSTTIPVGKTPVGIAVSPDGSKVYIGNLNSATAASVSVIDTKTNTVITTLNAGFGPLGLAVSPDGSRLYVANESPPGVSVLDISKNTILSTIALNSNPYGITLSADGSLIYVANYNASSVSVIDAAKNVIITTIPVGASPFSFSISPDGNQLFVTNTASGFISVINTLTNHVATNINTGLSGGTAVTPDGTQIYVVNSIANTVSIVDIASGATVSTIAVGTTPIAFGNFIIGGATCAGPPVTFTITVNPFIPPVLTYSGTLSVLTTTYGTASASTSIVLTGTNMQAGVLVSPPAGLEVSTDNIHFGSTITVGGAGTITNATVYIRLAATTGAGTYAGNVVLSSISLTTINVATPNDTVMTVPLVITAKDNMKVSGKPNPPLTIVYNGFVNNESVGSLITKPTITTTAKLNSPVGQYPIIASGATSFNYAITYVDGVLTITPAPPPIIIPNTFTPNGDGVNDIWDIPALISYAGCTVDIYTRGGQQIFHSVGYAMPWDGSYKLTTLPTGTYYYVIDAKNGAGLISGPVTLIR